MDANNGDLTTEMMKLPEIDEEEIEKFMILDKQEREFKARVWNNLNREWLTEQNEKPF